jgi:hypothetical protein
VSPLSFGESQFDPFDSYGDVSWDLEKVHLDNFSVFLQHERDSIGHITVYAGRRACVGEAKARALRAKKYLVNTRGVQDSRIKWIDAGYREELTVILQPVPPGAPKLTASPTLKPSEVRIKKDCKAKTRKHSQRAS